MSGELKLYEFQDESWTVLTTIPDIAEPHMSRCVVHVYDDPGLEDNPTWVWYVTAGMDVDAYAARPNAVLMWLIENHPGVVARQVAHMREMFEAKVDPVEALLEARCCVDDIDDKEEE